MSNWQEEELREMHKEARLHAECNRRIRELEFNNDSLRMDRDSIRHMRAKDNEHLITQRDKAIEVLKAWMNYWNDRWEMLGPNAPAEETEKLLNQLEQEIDDD